MMNVIDTRFLLVAAVALMTAAAAAPAAGQRVPGTSNAASAPLSYYIGESDTTFDPAVPSPEAFLGYEMGAHHTRHDQIVAYLKELARVSDRALYQEYGETYERRKLGVLIITSPANHARLEDIRRTHVQAAFDPSIPAGNRPLIVNLGHGVHGGETSGPEASLLTAYWLVAGQSAEVLQALEQTVFQIDPVHNPDGRDRHVTWVNGNRSLELSADPLDREHTEGQPGGRTNHYWFDLNRDWLPAENPESRGRLELHHAWLPNVVTDFHEMGTGSTYYFEPSKPVGSWNPLIPERLYTEITLDFAKYYVDALDRIGSLYFTKENYDNTYPGYGSTYPKFLGGYAITFEQASSRGSVQETARGLLTYAFTIRNQFRTAQGVVRAAIAHRRKLLEYQQEFFASALSEADAFPVKAYVFGDAYDRSKNRLFLEYLLRHRIEVHELAAPIQANGEEFRPGSAWVVPTRQHHYRLVRSIFERTKEFADSTFYDASTWTTSVAYGIPDGEVRAPSVPAGARVTAPPPPPVPDVPRAGYAYLLDWSDYFAPRALQHLLERDIRAQAGLQPFSSETNLGRIDYPRGTIVIPVALQQMPPERLHALIVEAARDAGVAFQSTNTGYSLQGVDLGSARFRPLDAPSILLVLGSETSTIWHLFDTKIGLPATKVDVDGAARADLDRYNVLILPSNGGSAFTGPRMEELKRWVRAGGTLVTLRGGTEWAVQNGFTPNLEIPDEASQALAPIRRPFADAAELRTERIGGSIWQADLDITHPLGFGYRRRQLAVWRDHDVVLPPSHNVFSTVAQLTADPHVSGYFTAENVERLRGASSVLADRLGDGSVVLLVDQPNFRGYWYGTHKLLLNAVYFRDLIATPPGGRASGAPMPAERSR
jgi:hypothetical protein